MSRLTAAERKRLPRSDFAIPAKAPGPGSYPIEDPSHERDAIARVGADGTPAEKAEVYEAIERKDPGLAKRSRVISRWRRHRGGAR